MSFKEQLQKDIPAVFVNPQEFAEEHNIDGENILCVIDTNIIHSMSSLVEGDVFGSQIVLFIAASKIEKPVRRQIMTIDSVMYLVQEVAENIGMYQITLEVADG